jgi:hypothetical protein
VVTNLSLVIAGMILAGAGPAWVLRYGASMPEAWALVIAFGAVVVGMLVAVAGGIRQDRTDGGR